MATLEKTKKKDKRGYIPVAIGLALIIIAVVILAYYLEINEFSAEGYLNRFYFWYVQAPLISVCLIAGAFSAVIGIAIIRQIKSKVFYCLIAVGFTLIAIVTYILLVYWVHWYINIIDFWNLSVPVQDIVPPDVSPQFLISLVVFNMQVTLLGYLLIGSFLIVLGIIWGIGIGRRLASVSLAGGTSILFFGLSNLWVNFESNNYLLPDWYSDLKMSWNSLISSSLIIGALFAILGAIPLLLMLRHRKTSQVKKV